MYVCNNTRPQNATEEWPFSANYYYYYIRLTAFFQDNLGKPAPETFWCLLEQEMMGWQWHHLDHMQIICTSLQTDNHSSITELSFYRPDFTLPADKPTASKH